MPSEDSKRPPSACKAAVLPTKPGPPWLRNDYEKKLCYPLTHKNPSTGKAIMLPTQAPELEKPTNMPRSFVGAQLDHILAAAGQKTP